MSARLWTMLTATRDEGVDSECGLLTAAGRRSLRHCGRRWGRKPLRHRNTETYGRFWYCGYWCSVVVNPLYLSRPLVRRKWWAERGIAPRRVSNPFYAEQSNEDSISVSELLYVIDGLGGCRVARLAPKLRHREVVRYGARAISSGCGE